MAISVITGVRADDPVPIFRPIQTSPDDMEVIDIGTVEEIMKGDLIRLDNGKRYILDGIRVSAFDSEDTIAYLQNLLVGKKVGIYVNPKVKENRMDRNGNRPGQVQTADGVWVQQKLVAKGLAWAYSTEVSRDLVLRLYKWEMAAREKKLGLWADRENTTKVPQNIGKYVNSFQLFDGVVRDVVKGYADMTFHFGTEPGKQFMLVLKDKNYPLFKLTSEEPMNFNEFKNVRIRVRGWVNENKKDNIPYMELTHPEQLEFPDFEMYNRELIMQQPNRPPVMPYDVKIGAAP